MTAVNKQNYIFPLQAYFGTYLLDIRGLKPRTVSHYFTSINVISKWLQNKKLLKQSLFEITDLKHLLSLQNILMHDVDFIAKDEKGNRMYSVGLNRYLDFVQGRFFKENQVDIKKLDRPIPKASTKTNSTAVWQRSSIIRKQAMEYADYKCEYGPDHQTFIAESNMRPYMEGHHALPMHLQPKFDYSLDIYANIICLCPICHRRIHFALKEEKITMLTAIFNARQERLIQSGIALSKDEFIDMVLQ